MLFKFGLHIANYGLVQCTLYICCILNQNLKTELTDIFSEFRTDGIQNYGRFGSVRFLEFRFRTVRRFSAHP